MQILEVAAGLVFHKGKLLITQRPAGSHLAGLWEFPGGKREPRESFEECLARELHEELGIEAQVGPLVRSLVHAYSEKTVQLNFYRCRLTSGEPKALGCAAFTWVTREELAKFSFPAADAALLGELTEGTELWD